MFSSTLSKAEAYDDSDVEGARMGLEAVFSALGCWRLRLELLVRGTRGQCATSNKPRLDQHYY